MAEQKQTSKADPTEQGQAGTKWINRQRTLIVCSHGVNHAQRDLANDIHELLPHSKKEVKIDRKNAYEELLDLCHLQSCNNFIYFEAHKRKNLFMWIGKAPNGPSYKFFVDHITTTKELKLTGNCIKGSRPILSFDAAFESELYLNLFKELAVNAFSTPNFHPQSRPFVDHTFSFNFYDNRIWFRNYQIIIENNETKLVEVGPRLALAPIKIFADILGGETLWSNPNYVSPAKQRAIRVAGVLKRQMVKRKAKELVKKKKIEDQKKEEDSLFNKEDMDEVEQ